MFRVKIALIYILIAIVYFLIIPDAIIRSISSERLAQLSEALSIGGLFSPLLSLLIFLGALSILLAFLSVFFVRRTIVAFLKK
ncbi:MULTISPECIES: hypothetical protein [unclassified Brenneria]|uniref:hypothetical protein n=1 Tax=unclassified Brenneria TaxID=2634434 RepID=UPI0029C11B82|nr:MULTISPECIES: hypothetical protein [unclassified Brenneria]MDX5627392.1 hypothetical protein [Brenneria sp. L3-3Z]MDX5694452.1 hypothetical protein [Brenneria sp. L4-2C]MEE3661924.1 hypothetical protein [Brenneria sp. g21c3]